METKERVTPEEFVNILLRASKAKNKKDLARILGVTPTTISNWSAGKTPVGSHSLSNIEEVLSRNSWGIQLGNISKSSIEILKIKRADNSQITQTTEKAVNSLQETFNAVVGENMHLKQKIIMLENQNADLKKQLGML